MTTNPTEAQRRHSVNVVNGLAAAVETLTELTSADARDSVSWDLALRAARRHMADALNEAVDQLPQMALVGRLVTDLDDMAALPQGTVVRDEDGDVGVRLRDGDKSESGGAWEWMSRGWGGEVAGFPVRVIDAPVAQP